MKKLELQNFGVQELEIKEMQEIDGGINPWLWLAGQVVENWNEIKKGVSDGWNGTYNPPK